MLEIIKNVTIASDEIKGYKFACANTPNKCQECGGKIIDFITTDIEEAYQHSKRNSVAIWISKS